METLSTELDQERGAELRMLKRMKKDLSWAELRYTQEDKTSTIIRTGFRTCRLAVQAHIKRLEALEPRALRVGRGAIPVPTSLAKADMRDLFKKLQDASEKAYHVLGEADVSQSAFESAMRELSLGVLDLFERLGQDHERTG